MNARVMKFSVLIGLIATLAGCAAGVAPIQPIAEAGGGQRLPLRNEVVSSVSLVADGNAEGGLYAGPTDAAPNADGTIIYFTAMGAQQPGVYQVAPASDTVMALTQGGPLVAPMGLAVSSDDETIYVADSQAAASEGLVGQVFAIPAGGGEAQPVAGTGGTTPRALAAVMEDGVEALYISGVDPSDGQPAVMRITPGAGDSLTIIVKGDPLVEPGGLAVAGDGTLYLADRLAAGGLGSIFRVEDGSLTPIAEGVRLGDPVGLALTTDDSLLLASALNPATGRAQVLLMDMASGEQAIINRVIEANSGSGGVHRAADVNVFAWADDRGNRGGGNGGGVYEIRP